MPTLTLQDIDSLIATLRVGMLDFETPELRRHFFDNYGLECPGVLLSPPSRHAEAIRKLPRIYHPDGVLITLDGRRFDVVFPELLQDPTLPPQTLPSLSFVAKAFGASFEQRRGRHRHHVSHWEDLP